MNEQQELQLIEQIKERKAVIVSAKHGMAKSTFIKRGVTKIGWELLEIDVAAYTTEEWEELYDLISVNIGESILYIPTIDRVKENRLVRLVKENNKNPIILETSMAWGFKELRAYCKEISLEVPDWRAMTEIMKQRKTYTGKTPQNLYHVYGDGDFERIESDFSLVAKFFNGEQVLVSTQLLPWLIDNAPNYLNGYELFHFLHYAAKLAAVGKVEFISGLAVKGSGNPERPYFLRKLGLVRNDGN